MPDESCRSCGGELTTHSLCSECRGVTQKVCKSCNALTRKQFHTECIKSPQIQASKTNQVVQLGYRSVVAKKHALSGRSLIMIFGIIGFFSLGFAAASYLGLFQNTISIPYENVFYNQLSGAQADRPAVSMNNIGHAVLNQSYENCLAYGSGETLTITCPTQYGYVYKAILDMPKNLKEKFSDTVFSIRGLGLTENPDGSVILQYHNNYYTTNFFAS
jgi:hypothetical protein